MALADVFDEYARRVGYKGPKKLGDEPEGVPAKAPDVPAATTWLREYLIGRVRFSDWLVITSVVLLCVLFLAGVALAIYHRDNPGLMSAIVGGDLLSLLAVVGWLHKITVQKTIMDAAMSVIDGLPPDKAASFLLTMHERYFVKPAGRGNEAGNVEPS
jgi:hypothetical protein